MQFRLHWNKSSCHSLLLLVFGISLLRALRLLLSREAGHPKAGLVSLLPAVTTPTRPHCASAAAAAALHIPGLGRRGRRGQTGRRQRRQLRVLVCGTWTPAINQPVVYFRAKAVTIVDR